MASTPTAWNFWLPDSDRSTGWTNHGYVLQFVCQGHGSSPSDAWDEAASRGGVPEALGFPDRVVAIRDDASLDLVLDVRRVAS